LNKLIPLLAFSILLLVPASQNAFANHPDILTCPPPGFLINDPGIRSGFFNTPFCQHSPSSLGFPPAPCQAPYVTDLIFETGGGVFSLYKACTVPPILAPDITLATQCQGASALLNNHCFAQALSNIIGGELLSINTLPLLVGAIGTNPIITGLVGITIAGIAGQAIWYVNSRRVKKVE